MAKHNGQASSIELSGLTPTHQRMMNLFGDGEPHSINEVHTCLWYEDGSIKNVYYQISTLRIRLREIGKALICIKHSAREGRKSDYMLADL